MPASERVTYWSSDRFKVVGHGRRIPRAGELFRAGTPSVVYRALRDWHHVRCTIVEPTPSPWAARVEAYEPHAALGRATTLELDINGVGKGYVALNGVEVPVTRLDLHVKVGEPTRVTLDLSATSIKGRQEDVHA